MRLYFIVLIIILGENNLSTNALHIVEMMIIVILPNLQEKSQVTFELLLQIP